MAKKDYLSLEGLGTLVDEIKAYIAGLLSGKADTNHTHKYAGSSTAGGSATSAVKLDTASAGSATQPVYFADGKPVKTTYTLGKSVPSDAKFTDTTYTLNSFGITATAAELNKMDGVTATTTELNYVDGVTSSIQAQLDAKVPTSRTVNGKALLANITLSASDVGADASGSASSALTSAKSYTDEQIEALESGSVANATKATQDASGNVITETYETKSDATSKLNTAKAYTDAEIAEWVGDKTVADQISDAVDAITPESIGASASGHAHVWSEVQDRPVVYGDTLTWDGNTEGLESVGFGPGVTFYKVSNTAFSLTDCANGGNMKEFRGGREQDHGAFAGSDLVEQMPGVISDPNMQLIMSITTDIAEEGITIKKGTYFAGYEYEGSFCYLSSLTINGYTGFSQDKFIQSYVGTDWDEQDETSVGFIKNRPFGEETTYGDTLTWDGNKDGREYIDAMGDGSMLYVHISDAVPTYSELTAGGTISMAGITDAGLVVGDEITFTGDEVSGAGEGVYIFNGDGLVIVVSADNTVWNGLTLAKAGVYVFYMNGMETVASLTINGYNGFPMKGIKQLDNKYLEPFETVGGDTLTWDGNTEGLENEVENFYKVTDIAPSIEDFVNGGSVTTNTGDVIPFTSAEIHELGTGVFIAGSAALIAVKYGTCLLAADGNYISSLTINGYTGFTTTKLKEEYLPEHTHSLSKSAVTTALGYTPPTSDTNTTYTVATGDSNGQIKVTPSSGNAYNVGVKGLAAAAYKAVADSTSASAISTGTSLVTERDVYYGLPKINNSNSYTRSTTIYAPTAGGTSKYFLCGAGTTAAPTWASPATARTNLELSYGTAAPSGTPSNGAVYFREDVHSTLPITEGGTGATSVSAARANLGLNHVGAAAVCKSDSRTISIKTAGGFAVIPMVQSALQTNDSNFTISNNGIQCPYSGYVYITGAIYVSTSGLAGCYIYKNGDNGELHSQYHTCSGCISSGGMLVPVTAGDVITMKARSSVANPTIGGNNKGTHLSIIYVA